MNIDYLEIVKKAFFLILKNPITWIFGFIVAFSWIISFSFKWLWGREIFSRIFFTQKNFFESSPFWFLEYDFWLIIFLAVIFLIAGFCFWGKSSLIFSLERIFKGKNISWREVFGESRFFVLRLFFLSFLVNSLSFLFLAGIFWPVWFLFAQGSYFLAFLLGILAFLISIVAFLLIFFVKTFGAFYLILGKIGILASIESSCALLVRRSWESLVMFSTIFFIGISVAFVFLTPFLVFLLLVSILAFPLEIIFGKSFIFVFLVTLTFFLLWLFRSFWEVFSQASWLLFFFKIAKDEEPEMAFGPEKRQLSVPEPEISGAPGKA